MFCTNCGKEIKPNDKFCANCGAPVNQGTSSGSRYDSVVFNPPFRKEADRKSSEILNSRGDFTKFTDLAQEENRRQQRSKNRMDWNLDGFPASSRVNNTPLFDWDSVAQRKKTDTQATDLSSTMEHVRVAPEKEKSYGLPSNDERVVPLDELEKELYALEDDLKTETARTAEYDKAKVKDIDSSVELDSYLDGISPEGKKPEKASEKAARERRAQAEAQAIAEAARRREEAKFASMTKAERVIAQMKGESSMKWNLQEPAHKEAAQAASSMGLSWDVDPTEIAKRKRSEKLAAQGEMKMIWNADEREAQRRAQEAARREAQLRAQMEAEAERRAKEEAERRAREEAEAAARAQAEAEAEALARAQAEAEAAEAARIQAEAEELARQKAEEEARALAEAEERARQEAAAQAAAVMAEQEARRQAEQVRRAEELEAARKETSDKISDDVSLVFDELLKEAQPAGYEKTRVFDQAALDALNKEAKERAESAGNEGIGAALGAAALGAAAAGIVTEKAAEDKPERSRYESDFVPFWEKEQVEKAAEEVAETEADSTEAMARLDALLDELAEEKHEPEPEPEAEPAIEEPVEEPVVVEPVIEEPVVVEPVIDEPIVVEPAAEPEAEPEPETPAEEDKFYTFSRKNAEFQELLQKEKERLREMGDGYVPKNTLSNNAVLANFGVLPTLAHEENGVYVEDISQPVHAEGVDYSGYGKPNEGTGWKPEEKEDLLSKIAAESPTPAQKTRLRYSDLFPYEDMNRASDQTRVVAAVKDVPETAESPEKADQPEVKERYQTATGITPPVKDENAPDINAIFDEDEAQKPKKHIVGNTIIVILVALILFEASILAAKLIAPDSAYSKLTDPVIEKIMDFATSIGKDKTPEEEPIDDEALRQQAEAITFEQTVNDLALQAATIGEIKYNPELSYDNVAEPHFEGVKDMIPMSNGLFTITSDGKALSYAEALLTEVVQYYDGWQSRNTDESYIGINSLEIGDIRTDGTNFYVLTREVYAKNDGSTATSVTSCRLTSSDDRMILEAIGEEQY